MSERLTDDELEILRQRWWIWPLLLEPFDNIKVRDLKQATERTAVLIERLVDEVRALRAENAALREKVESD